MRRTELFTALSLFVVAGTPALAEVTRFEVISRQPAAFEGRRFGSAGTVEYIAARVTFAVDPRNVRNKIIADIDRAPRDAKGMVEASTDVLILRPANPSGVMLVDVPNRGRHRAIGMLNDAEAGAPPGRPPEPGTAAPLFAKAAEAGDGFIFDQGATLVEIGWQGDIGSPAIALRAPVIKGLTGPARELFTFDDAERVKRFTLSYPSAEADKGKLTMHLRPDADATSPEGLGYKQIDATTIEITRPPGVGARAVYEFNYVATDPTVMGLGFAAVRDVVSFLKFDKSAMNPLAASGAPTQAIGFGISQSGRAIRDYLYLGFNADERGRRVLDGAMPIVPGARRSFTNYRFSQPGRNPVPLGDRFYRVALFPFAYEISRDPATGRTDGVLGQCRATKTCPKVFEIDSEYEFWGSQAGLNVTDAGGKALPLPPEVRAFMIVGAPHSSTGERLSSKSAACKLASSPVKGSPLVRALFVAMTQWLNGVTPPQSRYPSLADGTLVAPEQAAPINGPLPYKAQYAKAYRLEQTANGPVVRGVYPLSLPRAGPDGNALGGVQLPMVAAARATYTGWNPVTDGDGPEDLCTQAGGSLPFAATRAERLAAGDPRPSIEELYPSQAAYVAKVKAAADDLVAARLLLPVDAAADVRLAEAGRLARIGPASGAPSRPAASRPPE